MKSPFTAAGICPDGGVYHEERIGFDVGVPGIVVDRLPDFCGCGCGLPISPSHAGMWPLTHVRSGYVICWALDPESATAIAHTLAHLDWTVAADVILADATYRASIRAAVEQFGGRLGGAAGATSSSYPPVDLAVQP
jgi:hypothetical protein